jgi:hypothetical protein
MPANSGLSQTGRLEQRFRQRILNGDLGEGYSLINRARLASVVLLALSKNGFQAKTFSLSAGLELFYNIGKEVKNNGFDQLRASANIQYQVKPRPIRLLQGISTRYSNSVMGMGIIN